MATKSSGPLDDIVEPIQNGLTEIRKKIRNLEKKKLKLDTLRDEVKKSGKPLNEDQSQALARYEDNNQQLETFRELCKSFETCSNDVQKCYKKILKKAELAENLRLYDLEKYRAVVRAFESDEVLKRYGEEDESLQETQRTHLKVLRKILLPLRSDFQSGDVVKSLDDYLKAVAEQQSNLLHGRPVQLLEEAVPDAKALLDRVVASHFFTTHQELLFVKTIPNLGSVQQERTSLSATRAGPSSTAQRTVAQASPLKANSQDHHVQVGSSVNTSINQGFHYEAGEPIPSMSFTNSKLNHSSQSSVVQPSPPVATHNVYGGPTTPAHVNVQSAIPHAVHPSVSGHSVGVAALPVSSVHKEVRPVVAPVSDELQRRQSESDQVSQNQTAWQTGRPFGTFDANKTRGDNISNNSDAFPSVGNQENRMETEYDAKKGPNGVSNNGSNFNNGANFRVRGNGRPYEHQPDRRSFDGGRGGRRSEDGRGDSEAGGRGGGPVLGDRAMQRGSGAGRAGGRYSGDNRGPRGNGQEQDANVDDGDQHVIQKPQGGSSVGNDADFGVFHVDNPSFKGRTGNYGGGLPDDRRGNTAGLRRGAPRGGPQNGPRGHFAGNNAGRYDNGGSYEQ